MFPQKMPDAETMKQILLWVAALSFVSSSVAVVGKHTTEKVIGLLGRPRKRREVA
jgi:hypothetical protein